MARSLPLILVTLVIFIALISGVLIWSYFQPPSSQASNTTPELDWIVVAKTDLPWGVTLNESMVTRMTKDELTKQKNRVAGYAS